MIIAGSRHLRYALSDAAVVQNDYIILRDAVWAWQKRHGEITRILSGTNGYVVRAENTRFACLPDVLTEDDVIHGADLLGEYFGRVHRIPVERFPADWLEGSSGGPDRNARMIERAQGLVVIFFPDSRGSHDVLRKAATRRLRIVDVCLPFRRRW